MGGSTVHKCRLKVCKNNVHKKIVHCCKLSASWFVCWSLWCVEKRQGKCRRNVDGRRVVPEKCKGWGLQKPLIKCHVVTYTIAPLPSSSTASGEIVVAQRLGNKEKKSGCHLIVLDTFSKLLLLPPPLLLLLASAPIPVSLLISDPFSPGGEEDESRLSSWIYTASITWKRRGIVFLVFAVLVLGFRFQADERKLLCYPLLIQEELKQRLEMDSYSSGEELIIKTRKPYTITKQRERWTEDEHNRFLEALKLYGRAWQRIEEHIGTKTAVQIRSHAQKFFTKLEKEAMVKGIPLGQALDIEIPPPRPKRKPSNPYPRKIISSPASQMDSKEKKSVHPTCSFSQAELTIDLEKEPLPEISGDENLGSLATSSSSFNKNSSPALMASKKTYTFNEFVPALDGVVDMGESNESQVTVEPGANQILHELCRMQSCKEDNLLDEKLKGIKPKQPETFEKGPKDDWQFGKTQGRRATVQILDGSLSMTAPSVAQNLSSSEHHCGGSGYCVNQPNFGVVQNPDNYQSLVHVSSAFSNLILSALLPNPAVHAAASFAASFWPSPNINSSAVSPPQTNAAPSVAAIAAATVAAATAWWASNGLLPVCAPVQLGFNYAPASNCTVPPSFNQEREETTQPALDSEKSKVDDLDKLKGGKQIDRSSCGSNTASSSEVDTDALEKHGKGGEEFAVNVNVNVNVNPSSDRRSRSSSSTSESWKEVSEEGRQAFQALFSRQVLPQSFSPPYALNNRGNNTNQNCTSDEQLKHENSAVNNPLSSSSNMKEEGQLTLGKLRVRCTGFKPYKRCSVEAKESMLESAGKEEEGGGGGGQGTKRMRI